MLAGCWILFISVLIAFVCAGIGWLSAMYYVRNDLDELQIRRRAQESRDWVSDMKDRFKIDYWA